MGATTSMPGRLLASAVPGLLLLAASCSSPPAGAPAPMVLPAIPNGGGRVVADMKVVPVFFAGDPQQPGVEGFLKALAKHATTGMAQWISAVNELGGAMSTLAVEKSVVLAPSDAPPETMSDQDARAFIAERIRRGVLPANEPDKTIYVLYLPLATQSSLSIVNGQTIYGCTDYVGYHSHDPLYAPPASSGGPDAGGAGASQDAGAGEDLLYSIILRCPSFDPFTGANYPDQDVLTSVTSHELAEAASDPDWDAWVLGLFSEFGEGEDGDLCAWENTYEGGYAIQRIWSNAADLAKADPCLPARTEAGAPLAGYANAVPVPSAVVATRGGTAHFSLHVVSPNGSVTSGAVFLDAYFGIPGAVGFDHQSFKAHVGDVVSYDEAIPATLAPGYYWVDVVSCYDGDELNCNTISTAFAGVHVLP